MSIETLDLEKRARFLFKNITPKGFLRLLNNNKLYYREHDTSKEPSNLKEDLNKVKFFLTLFKSLNRIYPNLWSLDFSIQKNKEDKFIITIEDLIIFFPEVNITNSSSEKHTIKELWVKYSIIFRGDYMINTVIRGSRTYQTGEERYSNYIHSHLNSYRIDVRNEGDRYLRKSLLWSDFCLGQSELRDNLYILKVTPLNEYDNIEKLLLSILIGIETLAYWESKEGTPYIYIKNIRSEVKTQNQFYCKTTTANDFYNLIFLKYLVENNVSLDYKLKIDSNSQSVEILDTDKLKRVFEDIEEDLLNDCEGKDYPESKKGIYKMFKPQVLSALDTNSSVRLKYMEISQQTESNILQRKENPKGIMFKGTYYPCRIENKPLDIKKINYKIDESVKNNCKYKLSTELKNQINRFNFNNKYKDKINNIRETRETT